MIRIIVENKELTLNPDTVIKYSLVFPSPEADSMPSSVVQWFNVPANPLNDSILNFSRFIEVSNKIKVYENVIIFFGVVSQKGKMILKTTSNDSFKVSFTFNILPIGYRDKMLNNLSYANYSIGIDGDTATIIANAEAHSQMSYPATDFVFPPIYNPDFYDNDINSRFDDYANRYRAGFVTNFESAGYIYNKNALIPNFYLLSILETVLQNGNLQSQGTFFNDANIKKLLVFNNFALDYISFDEYAVKASTSVGVEIYESNPTNDFFPLAFTNKIDNDNRFNIVTSDYDVAVPGFYKFTLDFFLKIEEPYPQYLSMGLFVAILKDNVVISTLFDDFYPSDYDWHEYISEFSLYIDDITSVYTLEIYPFHIAGASESFPAPCYYKDAIYTINPASHNNVNTFSGDITTSNHVPKISVSEFINNLVRMFSLAVFFDNNGEYVSFDKFEDIIVSDNYLDLTEYYVLDSEEIELNSDTYAIKMELAGNANSQSVDNYTLLGSIFSSNVPAPTDTNQLYYVIDANKFILSYFNDVYFTYHWMTYRDDFENINENVIDAKNVDIKISTLPNLNIKSTPQASYGNNARLHSDAKITSLALGTGINPFSFQLFNYHGFVTNGGVNKPMASNTHFDSYGNDLGGLSLKLNGDDGIYKKYSEKYYNYLQDRELVKLKLEIQEKQLADIMQLFAPDSDTRKIRIKNRNYLPVQIDVEIGMNGIVNTLATLR